MPIDYPSPSVPVSHTVLHQTESMVQHLHVLGYDAENSVWLLIINLVGLEW